MKYIKAVTFVIAFFLSMQNAWSSEFKFDLDKDGIEDDVILSSVANLDSSDENYLKKTIEIKLSKSNKSIKGILDSETGSLSVRPGKKAGELVVDYTNRSSRDAPELNYYIYEWNENIEKLCLYSSVDGVPPNQLKKEIVSSDMSISLYGGCSTLEGNQKVQKITPPPFRLNNDNRIVDQYDEGQIPEWAALDFAARLSEASIDYETKIALVQKNHNNIASAIIILKNIVNKYPNQAEAGIILSQINASNSLDSENKKVDQSVMRCGWFENLTSESASLTDAEGKWTVGIRGGYQVKSNWPKFGAGLWVNKDDNHGYGYGYGCACLKIIASGKSHEIEKIISSLAKPLSACRNDAKLKEPTSD